MNAILCFKNLEPDDLESCPLGEELRDKMNGFHEALMTKVSLKALEEPQEEVSWGEDSDRFLLNGFRVSNLTIYCFQEVPIEEETKPGTMKRLYNFINAVKEIENPPKEEPEPERKLPEGELAFQSIIFIPIRR